MLLDVGLGKTIEAGIAIAQRWAERKRRVLLIVPATLRKQWERELVDKFYLPVTILDARVFNRLQRDGAANPFDQPERFVVCSYHFAAAKGREIGHLPWDLVVIDEAHRMRNVYRSSNKLARAVAEAIGQSPKLLVTATPLQNSLMELHGLVSVIDGHVFGDADSFRDQFLRAIAEALGRPLPTATLVFDYTGHGGVISVLKPLVGSSGWLELSKLTVETFETEEFLILAAGTDAGESLDTEASRKLFLLPAHVESNGQLASPPYLAELRNQHVAVRLGEVEQRNGRFFDEEVLKLDRWSDDLKQGLERELKDLDKLIREARKTAALAASLRDKLEAQKTMKALEAERSKKRRELFDAQDAIDRQRDELIGRIEQQLQQRHAIRQYSPSGGE